jgi:hypothetical protein
MRRTVIRIITWVTVAAAIASAFWLSSDDPAWPEWRHLPAPPSGR